jgi:hypothetical protein
MARRATKGTMKNRPAAKMRRPNWSVEAVFSTERLSDPSRRELLSLTEYGDESAPLLAKARVRSRLRKTHAAAHRIVDGKVSGQAVWYGMRHGTLSW